ncbi:uncharacterized protein LOC111714320 [Eurytemora carolleeae]|uniref:uncharacterized protein LOC111714320 n=1 Tax=Eurytemora carolleeae TaxID=1294199 RepID=UPI000C761EB0|nr:uncharacterized protein LOC111714320 [Eurytemora carolleeae]|eukprot:XP_023345171.1 uncharacterized protein LOC111714320 [Eurytemora affinis]
MEFDQMMELEPEQTAKQLILATQIIYIPITIINTVVDLKTGFIPGYLGYLTGAQPSSGNPIGLYLNAANIILALLATVFAYTFNTLYLKNKHGLIIPHEISTPQQNLISLKKLIFGTLVMTLLVIVFIVIHSLISPWNRQVSLPLATLYIIASVQLMLSKNENALNHFKQVLRIKRDNLEFSSFNLRQMFGRNNRVSAIA